MDAQTCKICETRQPTMAHLHTITLDQSRYLYVCWDCITDAVSQMVDDIEQAQEQFCKGCPQKTEGGCLQNVTADTCC